MPEAPRFTANTVTCRPSLGQEGRHTSENKSFASASLRCGTLRNEYKIERDAISLRPSLITLRHSILFSICRVARRARHCQDQKDRRRCIFALLDFGNYITPSCVPLIPHRHFFLRSVLERLTFTTFSQQLAFKVSFKFATMKMFFRALPLCFALVALFALLGTSDARPTETISKRDTGDASEWTNSKRMAAGLPPRAPRLKAKKASVTRRESPSPSPSHQSTVQT